jgi:hypothetical protein
MPDIDLPHQYSPRSYQRELWLAMKERKRAVLVWHRRAGKDKTVMNLTITRAWKHRVGVYYYFFPTYAQAKKVVWDGIDGNGFKFMDHFPPEIVAARNETEMQVTLTNGSIFQLVGTDKMDSIVGTNPVGCVFSEYSIQNPKAWDLVRPILSENGGWAVFIYTPRGKNHGHKLYRSAMESPDRWFVSLRTVDETRRDAEGEAGGYVVTPEQVDDERRDGMSEEMVQQEYYCSFEGAMEGAYYADMLARARKDGRVGRVPWDPHYPVDTAWDLGVGDANAIAFTQSVGKELRWIDFLESSNVGLDWYVKQMNALPYAYGTHYAPHDIKVREYSTGKSRWESAANLGVHFEIVPKLPVEDGINAVRRVLALSWFDEEKCGPLLDRLAFYHREYDALNAVWKKTPNHDWSSHAADMVRQRALAYFEPRRDTPPPRAITEFDPFESGAREETYDTNFSPFKE